MSKESYTLQEIVLGLRYGYLDSLESLKKAKAYLEYDKRNIKDMSIVPFLLEDGSLDVRFNFIPNGDSSFLDKFLGRDNGTIKSASYRYPSIPDIIYSGDGREEARILDQEEFQSLLYDAVSYPWFYQGVKHFVDKDSCGGIDVSSLGFNYSSDDINFTYGASRDLLAYSANEFSILQGLQEVFPSEYDRLVIPDSYMSLFNKTVGKTVLLEPELASYLRGKVSFQDGNDAVVLKRVK